MQYIVNEVQVSGSATGEAKLFNTLLEAVSYLQKANKNMKLLMGNEEMTLAKAQSALNERLATVSVVAGQDKGRKWIITVF
jgi:spore coat polysaccharide biosynthesis predicted glycosyltransferase SpsG